MPSFGYTSSSRLDQVHPILRHLCFRVVEYRDITIICGYRSKEAQEQAFQSGASKNQYPDSKHNNIPSEAVDVAPWPIPAGWGDINSDEIESVNAQWKERVKFYEMVAVFRFAWAQMCEEYPGLSEAYDLRFGADWDGDGDYNDQTFDDLAHIEIIEKLI